MMQLQVELVNYILYSKYLCFILEYCTVLSVQYNEEILIKLQHRPTTEVFYYSTRTYGAQMLVPVDNIRGGGGGTLSDALSALL